MPSHQRYVVLMSALVLVDLTFTTSYAVVSGNWSSFVTATTLGVIIFGLINVVGARMIITPLRLAESGKVVKRALLSKRLRRLPIYSAVWAFVLGATFALIALNYRVFIDDSAQGMSVSQDKQMKAALWFSLVYAIQFGVMAYFIGVECATHARRTLLVQHGITARTARNSLGVRIAFGMAVVAILPVSISLMDVLVFEDVRAMQGLTLQEALILDAMSTGAALLISIVVICRSFTKPLAHLTEAMTWIVNPQEGRRVAEMTDDELGALSRRFNQMMRELEEKQSLSQAFYKFVDKDVVEKVLSFDQADPRVSGDLKVASVLFTDIVGFSALSETMAPNQMIEVLNKYFEVVTDVIRENDGIVVNFIGDQVYAAFNILSDDSSHASSAVRTALQIEQRIEATEFPAGLRLKVRTGVNSGSVVAGIVGTSDKLAYSVYGEVVNFAARLEQLNKRLDTSILIGVTTANLATDLRNEDIRIESRGQHQIRGMTGEYEVYEVTLKSDSVASNVTRISEVTPNKRL